MDWLRVKERLRVEVGDDVYSSWFARMELDGVDGDTVKLSVPRAFSRAGSSRIMPKSCWPAGRRSRR